MLEFSGDWRFDSPGPIPDGVLEDFTTLIGRVTTQGDHQEVFERFKSYFAAAAGTTASWSSSTSWAQSDLHTLMSEASSNAPLFIEAFYEACEALRRDGTAVPDVKLINRILARHEAGYDLRPPRLVATGEGPQRIDVPHEAPSLDRQARDIIQRSLSQSEDFLKDGHDRQAVQEVLWLLETISTAFQGVETDMGTVQGKSLVSG